MIGKTDAELTPGEWATHYVEDDKWVMKTGFPKLGILELWFDEVGLPGFYLTNKYPRKNDQGRVFGIMGTIQAARRMQCSNNLKQLGLALHNYASASLGRDAQ